ncbi:hypothetical protein CUV01_02405 [Paracoccus tegillarcae]|uniref:Uncharacterized protein n=1 Tax=Paracoccus tegillarcae TaxID=1529068 RepID=A0A2K9EWG2_9RHOB|nr:hypothetical protein CUV01_02405 [Paracoccus tegillarcae]
MGTPTQFTDSHVIRDEAGNEVAASTVDSIIGNYRSVPGCHSGNRKRKSAALGSRFFVGVSG